MGAPTLTLIRNGQAAEPARPQSTRLRPVRNLARETALQLTREPDVAEAKNDAIDTFVEHFAKARDAATRAKLIAEFWDNAFAGGYEVASEDRVEAGIAEALADVIPFAGRKGGPVA